MTEIHVLNLNCRKGESTVQKGFSTKELAQEAFNALEVRGESKYTFGPRKFLVKHSNIC